MKALVLAVALFIPALASAQETVRVVLPLTVSFNVVNVSVPTTGSPNPTSISFSKAILLNRHALLISVRADGDLTGPGGQTIAVSNVSWTAANVSNGIAVNGVLSSTAYSQVFQSNGRQNSGGCDLTWTLGTLSTPLRAGVYQAVLRWKFESILP